MKSTQKVSFDNENKNQMRHFLGISKHCVHIWWLMSIIKLPKNEYQNYSTICLFNYWWVSLKHKNYTDSEVKISYAILN